MKLKVLSGSFLALVLASGWLLAVEPQHEELVGPESLGLAAADFSDEGPGVVVWKNTDAGRSKIELHDGNELAGSWEFPGVLMKSVDWIDVGHSFQVGLIEVPSDRSDMHGGIHDTRIYEISASGELVERARTQDLEEKWGDVSLSKEGDLWVAYSFEGMAPGALHQAEVVLGHVGEKEPFWTWPLVPEQAKGVGDPLDGFNYAAVFGNAENPMVVVLWAGDISIAWPKSEVQPVELARPEGCKEFRAFYPVSDDGGLWALCGVTFAWFRTGEPSGTKELRAEIIDEFNNPWFRTDGTVVDLYRRFGLARVHHGRSEAGKSKELGEIDLAAPGFDSRWIPSGDVLLESIGKSDRYRILRVGPEIQRLRQN